MTLAGGVLRFENVDIAGAPNMYVYLSDRIDGQPDALVDLTAAAVAELQLRPGQQVWLSAKATEVDVYAG